MSVNLERALSTLARPEGEFQFWRDDGPTHLQVVIDFLLTQISQVEDVYIFTTLSNLKLSREDILDVSSGDKGFTNEWMLVGGLIDTAPFNIYGRTAEIEANCQIECNRQEIASHDGGVIITLVRAEDGTNA